MTIPIIITALALLSTTVALCVAWYAQCRADNLDILNCDLRDQLANAHAALDDATREADRYRTSNAHLIAENTTLCVDLAYGESIVSACRSHRQRRRDEVAGWIVLSGLARGSRKMVAWEKGAP